MKELFVKRIKSTNNIHLAEASHLLAKNTVLNKIDTINWVNYSYKPEVSFRIGHNSSQIWLSYEIKENHIRALETRTNGDVYKDSCVEFFISPDGNNYYNFEFNCIGTIHQAYGPDRNNRRFVDPEIIQSIEIESSLGNQPFKEKSGNFSWELMVKIPVQIFQFTNLNSFNKLKATANFYKCGDETTLPHYVTWNPVKTDEPDYHQPKFFGKVLFE